MPLIATRPLEYVCLFPADIPTEVDGDVFVFMFVDAYSRFLFKPMMEKDREPQTVLKCIGALLENKDFMQQNKNGFTIVLHKYHDIVLQAKQLVIPHKGNVIVNDAYVTQVVMPVLQRMFEHMKR